MPKMFMSQFEAHSNFFNNAMSMIQYTTWNGFIWENRPDDQANIVLYHFLTLFQPNIPTHTFEVTHCCIIV